MPALREPRVPDADSAGWFKYTDPEGTTPTPEP